MENRWVHDLSCGGKHLAQRMVSLVRHEWRQHPEAEMEDFYKLLYQSIRGIDHLVPNPESFQQYLTHEMIQLSADRSQPLAVDITLTIPIVRVNLCRAAAERITPAQLTEICLKGLVSFKNPLAEVFGDCMQLFGKVLVAELSFSAGQVQNFCRLAEEMDYPPFSHSATYRHLYAPHYRIVPQSVWQDFLEHRFQES